jgi:hypothetical protein
VGAFLPPPGQPDPKMDPKFRTGSFPAITTFGFEKVSPPSTLYMQRDDQLVLDASTLLAGEVVTFTVRFLEPPALVGGQPSDQKSDQPTGQVRAGGFIQPQTFQIRPLQGGAGTRLVVNLGEGYLLSIAAVSLNAVLRGQTFARATMFRGSLLTAILPTYTLFADYPAGRGAVGWPGGRVLSQEEGQGAVSIRQQGNPGAGVDWFFSTPFSVTRSKVTSFSAQFVANATVINRNVEVIVDDGANTVWRTSVPASITAGQTVFVSGAQSNAPTGVVATDLTVLLPPGLVLRPGWRLRTLTANLQGTDAWTNIWLLVEDLLEQF